MNNVTFDLGDSFGSVDKLANSQSSLGQFGAKPLEPDGCFLVSSSNNLVALKNFSSEIRALRDVEQFIDQSTILLDVTADSLEQLLITIIDKTIGARQNYQNVLQAKDNALISSDVVMLNNSIQLIQRDFDGAYHYDHSWICATIELPFLQRRHVSIVRLKEPFFFSENAQNVKILLLVLAPSKEKFTKNAFETARTFCTMFYERETRDILLHTDSLATLLMVIRQKARSLVNQCQQMDMLEHAPGTGAHRQPSRMHFSTFQGLKENVGRRIKYYGSDFVDAFRDGKSIQKVISTTFFLYFACILPTLAFGVLDDKATDGLIDARKALIGQAIGGLVFAFLSGQPLVIIATTAPLCLYTKIIMEMSQQFEQDFFAMFALVGIFNGLFLTLYAILDLSQLMRFCTRGIEEIFATFIFFAFVLDAIKDVNYSFYENYFSRNCTLLLNNVTFTNETVTTVFDWPICKRDSSLLFLLLMFGTFWLSTQLLDFSRTPFLNNSKRELISDYSLPLAVLAFSALAKFGFPSVDVEKFVFRENFAFEMARIDQLSGGSILVCLGLGFSLSLLFFMDQNVSAAMVQSPKNKLKKGNSYDWDILLVGLLNVFLGLFSLPYMHGILPHSPLHARNLADIEYRVEHGQITEHVIMVRETRVAAILAHIMIALSLFLVPYPLDLIPIPVLDGLFLYCAFSTLRGNAFYDRIMLWFTEQCAYPPTHFLRRVKLTRIHLFTLVQAFQLIVVCVLGFAPYPFLQMIFPVIIFILIPIRGWILPIIFDQFELDALDPYH